MTRRAWARLSSRADTVVHRLPERGALIEHAPQRINAAARLLRQRNAPHGFGAAEALELLEKVAWLDDLAIAQVVPGIHDTFDFSNIARPMIPGP